MDPHDVTNAKMNYDGCSHGHRITSYYCGAKCHDCQWAGCGCFDAHCCCQEQDIEPTKIQPSQTQDKSQQTPSQRNSEHKSQQNTSQQNTSHTSRRTTSQTSHSSRQQHSMPDRFANVKPSSQFRTNRISFDDVSDEDTPKRVYKNHYRKKVKRDA
jgi:hypothetical protein